MSTTLEKIKSGETQMKPKWHFVFATACFAVGIALASAIALFIISFALFVLRRANGPLVPIALLLFGIGIIILIEFAMQRFAFVYRTPILYSLIILLGIIVALSFLVQRAKVHDRFAERARDHRLPVMGKIYRNQHLQMPMRNNLRRGL